MLPCDTRPWPSSEPAVPTSTDLLFPRVYNELRLLAAHHLARERSDHTLDPTALVHEAYLRLRAQSQDAWHDRGHFLAIAAQAMRRVLLDHARRHLAAKRGGARQRISLDDTALAVESRADALVALDQALHRLETLDPRLCRVVEYRFYSGLSDAETAAVLGLTTRTVQRDWTKAKAWLYKELYG